MPSMKSNGQPTGILAPPLANSATEAALQSSNSESKKVHVDKLLLTMTENLFRPLSSPPSKSLRENVCIRLATLNAELYKELEKSSTDELRSLAVQRFKEIRKEFGIYGSSPRKERPRPSAEAVADGSTGDHSLTDRQLPSAKTARASFEDDNRSKKALVDRLILEFTDTLLRASSKPISESTRDKVIAELRSLNFVLRLEFPFKTSSALRQLAIQKFREIKKSVGIDDDSPTKPLLVAAAADGCGGQSGPLFQSMSMVDAAELTLLPSAASATLRADFDALDSAAPRAGEEAVGRQELNRTVVNGEAEVKEPVRMEWQGPDPPCTAGDASAAKLPTPRSPEHRSADAGGDEAVGPEQLADQVLSRLQGAVGSGLGPAEVAETLRMMAKVRASMDRCCGCPPRRSLVHFAVSEGRIYARPHVEALNSEVEVGPCFGGEGIECLHVTLEHAHSVEVVGEEYVSPQQVGSRS